MKVLITTLLLLNLVPSFAQQAIIGGHILHHTDAISLANVELHGIKNPEYIRQTQSDSSGYFQFSINEWGKYIIRVSYLGYQEFKSDTIKITKAGQFKLNIFLKEAVTGLDEVTVKGKKQLLEIDKGKMIYNLQNLATTSGLTAFELLKRIPGVSIGQNEELLFRGSPGINIMMDGKRTYLTGEQLASYLKGLSAEDLSKIEVITTPPAEFDAAGNAGIINIVRKINLAKGYAVDLRSSVSKGKYWMNNQNLSANYRTSKWDVNGMFDFKRPDTYTSNRSGNTINDRGTMLQLSRQNQLSKRRNFYTWRLGTEWKFLPRHKIGINYDGYLDDYKSYNHAVVDKLNKTGSLQSFILSDDQIIKPYHYDALNLNYKYAIDSSGKKITADAYYTSYRNFSDGLMTTGNFDANGTFLYNNLLRSHQPGFIKIKSFQTDAELPYNHLTLKAGLKYAEVENDNAYRFDTLRGGDFVEVATMSNHFRYKERIAAAYVSASRTFGKTNIEAGLRLEHTYANGLTVKQDVNNEWIYTQLFPSLAIEQPIGTDNMVDFSVSRRINRPSYTELNPVRWYTDPYFYYSGNPNLVPEMAWVYNLTYTLKRKYIVSLVYNQNLHYINRKLVIDDNGTTIKTQSANFGTRDRIDLTFSAPLRLFPFWEAQAFSDISYMTYPISGVSGDKKVSQWSAVFSLQQDISLPRGFKINISGFYYTSELRGIYLTSPAGWIDLGIKRSFLTKKLDIQFSVSDVFNTSRYWASSLSDVTNYYYREKPYSRIIALSLKYHFGGELIRSGNRKTEEQQRL